MCRSPIAFLLFTACLACNALAAVPPRAVPGLRQGAPNTEMVDSVVAAAVVNAISAQFGGRSVDVKLDAMDVQPTSIRDRTVSGKGHLQFEGDDGWIGFRFHTLYDSLSGDVGFPELTIGGVTADEKEIPNDSTVLRKLDAEVATALSKEFGQQKVRLQLNDITTVEAGSHCQRINATGIADFGRDGSTPARIEALYDHRKGEWLWLHYELDAVADDRTTSVPFAGR